MRLFVLTLVFFLAACGQKGPLYLPDDQAAGQTAAGGDEVEESTRETTNRKK